MWATTASPLRTVCLSRALMYYLILRFVQGESLTEHQVSFASEHACRFAKQISSITLAGNSVVELFSLTEGKAAGDNQKCLVS